LRKVFDTCPTFFQGQALGLTAALGILKAGYMARMPEIGRHHADNRVTVFVRQDAPAKDNGPSFTAWPSFSSKLACSAARPDCNWVLG
jgi:hypothetical protein